MWSNFVALLFGHAISDLALQSEWVGLNKSRHYKRTHPLTGADITSRWIYFMAGHAMVNGALVYFITRSTILGLYEAVAHFFIDCASQERWIPFWLDQTLHALCKLVWAWAWTYVA